jgi:hypothetical protein
VKEAHIILLQEEVDRLSKEKIAVEDDNNGLKEQLLHLEQFISSQEKKIVELRGTVQKYKRVQHMVRSAGLSVGRRPSDSTSASPSLSQSSGDLVFSPEHLSDSPNFSMSQRYADPNSGDSRVRRDSLEEDGGRERVKGRKEIQGFGRGRLMPHLGQVSGRSSSEPNLALTDDFMQLNAEEVRAQEGRDESPSTGPHRSGTSTGKRLKRSASAIKGSIGRAFGRLKRYASFSTVHTSDEDSTLSGESRPGWTVARSLEVSQRDHPMSEWDCEAVCQWLKDIGLEMYVDNCKRSGTTGLSFLSMTDADIQQVLFMNYPMHRKKLKLALQNIPVGESGNLSRLDHEWVCDWLGEIGLPQYKGLFLEARVDGHVLNSLTIDDLYQLKVMSDFHHVSLKRAIQCLRQQNFSRSYMIGPTEDKPSSDREYRLSEVTLWNNARVCQWLDCIEMSEYAGNLRESGVHGALITLEPRFNADSLAATLQVKELIRRHLSQHFSRLIGAACLITKREAEQSKGYIRLEPQNKRSRRRLLSLGTMRSKQKMELEWKQTYVCPLDLDMPAVAVTGPVAMGDGDTAAELQTSTIYSQPGRKEQRTANGTSWSESVPLGNSPQGMTTDIEAMSREMDSLTEMINKELAKKATPSPFT